MQNIFLTKACLFKTPVCLICYSRLMKKKYIDDKSPKLHEVKIISQYQISLGMHRSRYVIKVINEKRFRQSDMGTRAVAK